MDPEVIVTDEAFPYLVAQRGFLDHLKGDRDAWEAAYCESLARDFEDLRPHLPDAPAWVLDVGGGMSGISVLLARHYGPGLNIAILDGASDDPKVVRHSKTFSHAQVAKSFLRANGVHNRLQFLTGVKPLPRDMDGVNFGLVLGLQSWGFHFAPEPYLTPIALLARTGSVFVLDVRHQKADWQDQLDGWLRERPFIRRAEKYTRRVYVAR